MLEMFKVEVHTTQRIRKPRLEPFFTGYQKSKDRTLTPDLVACALSTTGWNMRADIEMCPRSALSYYNT
jgi:hypothetical protein